MRVEHLLLNSALAMGSTTLYRAAHQKIIALILLLGALAPDTVAILVFISDPTRPSVENPLMIFHPFLHTLLSLCLFTLLITPLLVPFEIRWQEGAFFAFLGFGAHLLEDAIVFRGAYPFLWPWSSQRFGLGIIHPYTIDVAFLGNAQVILVSILLIVVALIGRIVKQGIRPPR